MSWYAKPSGAYSSHNPEGVANILEIASFLSARGYDIACQSGIAGNIMAEGGLNPWRWEGDVVNLNRGYGLFQYTPASEYINTAKNVNYYAPNLSVTSITTDAKPTDAIAQLEVFDRNLLSKWVSTCWRNYWSTDTYSSLYQDTRRILFTYGSNQRLSMEQFKRIDDIYDATLAFLACFEGPQVPNMATRYSNARLAYNIITGKPPTPPTPPTPTKRKLPIWMMIKPF